MNYIDNIITIEGQTPVMKKTSGRCFVRSLEYEVIANLVMKQYSEGDEILFGKLLSIPVTERIPGLINEYGLKKAHRLVRMILQEFCCGVGLPKSKKLTETKISTCACDLILAAYEDQLSLEDLIIFFERAKEAKYGKFKGMPTHFDIMRIFEKYRMDRTEAYHKLREKQERQLKQMNELPRIGEVRSIGEIMKGANVIDMTQRMSG